MYLISALHVCYYVSVAAIWYSVSGEFWVAIPRVLMA